MNTRAQWLAQRRQYLIAESAVQREELAQQAQPVARTLETVETGMRIVERIRQHPGWLLGAVAGLLALRPRRLSALLQFGTSGLRTWRQLAPALQSFIARD
jgi:hypothetical protein